MTMPRGLLPHRKKAALFLWLVVLREISQKGVSRRNPFQKRSPGPLPRTFGRCFHYTSNDRMNG